MKNFTNEMKKNVLRFAAGALTALALTAAPLSVSAAEHAPVPPANSNVLIRQNDMSPLLAADIRIDDKTDTTYFRDSRFTWQQKEPTPAKMAYYTLDDFDFPSIYPGEYITNDFDEPMYLVFFDSDADYYVMVTLPAGDDYLVQYEESVSGVTVETYDCWDCVSMEDNFFFFLPHTGF